MAQYESLVRQLDVAQDMVEIEATIIDVSTDEFESLGIDWDYSRAGQGAISVQTGSIPIAGNITTLVADAGRSLLTHIKALEGNDKARIVARPKVLGSANRTAVMVDKRIASIKVAGNLDANLFNIEAGTTLQVQPQIVTYGDHREVKLTLFIQDGNFESAAVDQIPVIKRTEINTEATMREGESLLIGGISVESDSFGRSGLPGLSRIPFIGGAFRTDEGKRQRSERLFLITPKVINSEGTRRVASTVSGPIRTQATPYYNAPVAPPAPVVPALPAPTPLPAAAPVRPVASNSYPSAAVTALNTETVAAPTVRRAPTTADANCAAASVLGLSAGRCDGSPTAAR